MSQTADVAICGAGITGVVAAYFLSRAGIKNIRLIDERPPLSLTSDRSTECYRNWWPNAEMLALMNRSIDLMEMLAEESGNVFRMNRRGYLYVTADEEKVAHLRTTSQRTSDLGAGPLRLHSSSSLYYQPSSKEGFHDQPTGADLLIGNELIRKYFPYLTEHVVAALHVRRAGWLSAQQLGMYMLETARQHGVRFESARVIGVDTGNDCVKTIRLSSGERIDSPIFINAAGPYFREVGRLLGIDLPVHTELHLKAAIKDPLGVVGRDAPLLIWMDPQPLPWQEAADHAFHRHSPGGLGRHVGQQAAGLAHGARRHHRRGGRHRQHRHQRRHRGDDRRPDHQSGFEPVVRPAEFRGRARGRPAGRGRGGRPAEPDL